MSLIGLHSITLERGILKSILKNGASALDIAAPLLGSGERHFLDEIRQNIYDTLIELYNSNANIGTSLVFEKIKSRSGFNQSIREEFAKVNVAREVEDLTEACNLLLDYSMKRKIGDITSKAINDITIKDDKPYSVIVDEIVDKLTSINPYETVSYNNLDINLNVALEEINKRIYNYQNNISDGIHPGFKPLKEHIGDLTGNQFIVIAGRPGQGKTAFVVSMMLEMAKQDIPVAFFSLEMDRQQLMDRIISRESGISLLKIRTGNLMDYDTDAIAMAYHKSYDLQLLIDDSSRLTINMLRSKMRNMIKEYGVKAIFIDYLQLMSAPGDYKSEESKVAYLSNSLKKLSKDYNVPIICLAQLNREVEKRASEDARPQLSDLRGSGAIEMDADIVMFIHKGVVDIAKQRQGAVGVIHEFRFDKALTSFYSI